MSKYTNIADAAAERHRLSLDLENHLAKAKAEEARLRGQLAEAQQALSIGAAGLDLGQIAVAESVLFVRGAYAKAGDERASVVHDAIAEIATGERQGYLGLWEEAFGTKSYDRWHGQRSDHGYGYGPKHGSIIFQVGLQKLVRDRSPRSLSESERNACVYYLLNLEQIQAQRVSAEVAA